MWIKQLFNLLRPRLPRSPAQHAPVAYKPVETDGTARAAQQILDVTENPVVGGSVNSEMSFIEPMTAS